MRQLYPTKHLDKAKLALAGATQQSNVEQGALDAEAVENYVLASQTAP